MKKKAYLKDIQKLIRQKIDVIDDQPYVDDLTEIIVKQKQQQRNFKRNRPQGQGDNRRTGGRWKGNNRNSDSRR
jgi:hypothetical protein